MHPAGIFITDMRESTKEWIPTTANLSEENQTEMLE